MDRTGASRVVWCRTCRQRGCEHACGGGIEREPFVLVPHLLGIEAIVIANLDESVVALGTTANHDVAISNLVLRFARSNAFAGDGDDRPYLRPAAREAADLRQVGGIERGHGAGLPGAGWDSFFVRAPHRIKMYD